ncbi:MAG TPA: DUF6073 family protein, partial [Pyrinomonadaceae bacterium]|nr:DUF6073 family protein [Pyrinomonadaceae bacterium]
MLKDKIKEINKEIAMYQENTGVGLALEQDLLINEENNLKLLPNPKSLSDLRVLTMPEGGVDSLNFIAWDTIEVIGFGEDTVELKGYYVIDRANPTDSDWINAS